MLAALFADRPTTEAALELATAGGRPLGAGVPAWAWPTRALRRAAAALVDLAAGRLDRTGLPPDVRAHVTDTVQRRLHAADRAEEQR